MNGEKRFSYGDLDSLAGFLEQSIETTCGGFYICPLKECVYVGEVPKDVDNIMISWSSATKSVTIQIWEDRNNVLVEHAFIRANCLAKYVLAFVKDFIE
jgi:hypothetical protein